MKIWNARGQIAIFVVLVFQVLFILFAMTINVGMVVYDKINFQNSLDMAVYYGAKQQAEVLNAMAHINYQMRQNWKLLAWRYRILGNLLQDKGEHRDEGPKPYWCPQNSHRTTGPCTEDGTTYFICISGHLWKRGVQQSAQNLCKKEGVSIPPITSSPIPSIPVFGHAMSPILNLAGAGSARLVNLVTQSCPLEETLNWLTAQLFLTHFRLDQRDRKSMMKMIFNKSLALGLDLDGQSLLEGAKKVFYNNLTKSNQANVNSAGGIDAVLQGFNSFKGLSFEDVFEPIDVHPILRYLGLQTGSSIEVGNSTYGDCNVQVYPHTELDDLSSPLTVGALQTKFNGSSDRHSLYDHIQSGTVQLFNLNFGSNYFRVSSPGQNPIASLVLGFIKNRDKVLYYGLRAEMDYLSQNQVFSLNLAGGIQFKASAFAKAFGGRFGPQDMDPLIGSLPNYSRWPGDQLGLIERYPLHDGDGTYSPFLNKFSSYPADTAGYTIEDFFHLIFYPGTADDPLSRGEFSNFLRMMELMAVYPDVYDLSFYSISANYMETYFPRICKLLRGGACQATVRNQFSTVGGFSAYIRGDFGWPEQGGGVSSVANSLRGSGSRINTSGITLPLPSGSHYTIPGSAFTSPGSPHHGRSLSDGKIFYPWLAQKIPDHILSSWAPDLYELDYEQYELSSSSFLKCHDRAFPGMPVDNDCIKGGRSGYSVKLISCETAQGFSKAPSNMSEYCP